MRTLLHRLAASLLVAAVMMALAADHAEAGVNRKIIYLENHAGSRWPVRSVAEKLDNGTGLDFRVVRRCPAGPVTCVRVYSVERIPGRTIGLAYPGHRVELENRWGRHATRRERRSLTCHELGHIAGLSHRGGRTCMNAYSLRHTRIKKAEKRQLKRMWNPYMRGR